MLYPDNNDVKLGTQVLQDPRYLSVSEFLARTRAYLNGTLGTVERSSPFLLHWGFHALRYYYNACKQYERPHSKLTVEDIQKIFHALEGTWKVAGMMPRPVDHNRVAKAFLGVYKTLFNACQEALHTAGSCNRGQWACQQIPSSMSRRKVTLTDCIFLH
jgi:hypothetical protein